jgi:integrase|tara:strand:- start:756 stop:2078 length:1323 start_codon:yes stop_codon:yes gene_type:complete
MKLSKQQKKKLTDFRSWVKKERRRHRIASYPKFSFGVDNRTLKIKYRFNINEVVGYDTIKDEPILKRKKVDKYTSIPLNEYELINVRHIFQDVKKRVAKSDKKVSGDSNNLQYWMNDYYTTEIRNGRKLTEVSLRSDKDVLLPYAEYIQKYHPKYLDIYQHINGGKKVLDDYLNHKRNSITKYNRPPSKNTLNNTYRRIKGFFNWLSEKDGSFPYNMLKLKGYAQERNKDKLPPATSIEDMKKLIKWMDENIENKYEKHFIPILRLLLISGCRISEAVSMKIDDIDFKQREWSFFGKNKWRTIKLDSDTLWNDLDYWVFDKKGKVRKDKKFVFHLEYWRKGNKEGKGGGIKLNLDKHITASGITHKFKRVIKGLGLNPKLTPHSCRRGFITYMLEKTNGNVPMVAQLVGHSTWEMVNRYNRARLPKERTTINLGEVIKGE